MRQAGDPDRVRGRGHPVPMVAGPVTVRRLHIVRYPSYELRAGGDLTVRLGRYSTLNIYFGWGQRIDLPWRARWRILAVQKGPLLQPVVVDEAEGRLAAGAAWLGNYGINGRDYAYTLSPAQASRLGRPGSWHLCAGEQIVARFTRRPFGALCDQPIPLPAVLLGLLFVRLSIPGEGTMRLPELHWG